MEGGMALQFRELGVISVLILAAIGSIFGAGAAGFAAIGAWKKAFLQNKSASFMLVAFVGAPLTQTIYGMIVMNKMADIVTAGNAGYLWVLGILCGTGMGLSAFIQGKAGAMAADAMGETNKGFGNYIAVLGMIETVAVFIMVFTLSLLGKLAVK